MKKLITLIIIIGFIATMLTSCVGEKRIIVKPNGEPYAYVCGTVNSALIGKGWNEKTITSRSMIGCDSFNMVSDSNAYIWAEGRRMEVKANEIIAFASQTIK